MSWDVHSNVDMKSGAPAFGTPEYIRATQMTGPDGAVLWAAVAFVRLVRGERTGRAGDVGDNRLALGGGPVTDTHAVYHAAGWLEGGLIASPEKFVMDCEVFSQMIRYFDPAITATTPDDIAVEAIGEVGGEGHFFGIQHTQDRYEDGILSALSKRLAQLRRLGNRWWRLDGGARASSVERHRRQL